MTDGPFIEADVALAAVEVSDVLERFTDDELVNWYAIGNAIDQAIDRGDPYLVIPLRWVFTAAPFYPVTALQDPRLCSAGDGFVRDATVDYWCLLEADHPGVHGWYDARVATDDAAAQGYEPETLEAGPDLVDALERRVGPIPVDLVDAFAGGQVVVDWPGPIDVPAV